MPNLVLDLIVDRVDLVEEGANSASFITIFKGRETKEMTIDEVLKSLPEDQQEIVKSAINSEELKKATDRISELEGCLETSEKELTNVKEQLTLKENMDASGENNEEEVLKSVPKEVQDYIAVIKAQKEVAEEAIRKAKEQAADVEAKATAALLKSIPVDEATLVGILKSADATLVEVLKSANAAIEGVVLDETGSNTYVEKAKNSKDAWAKIEKEAEKLIAEDSTLSKQKAITKVVEDNRDLYKEYLKGGAN